MKLKHSYLNDNDNTSESPSENSGVARRGFDLHEEEEEDDDGSWKCIFDPHAHPDMSEPPSFEGEEEAKAGTNDDKVGFNEEHTESKVDQVGSLDKAGSKEEQESVSLDGSKKPGIMFSHHVLSAEGGIFDSKNKTVKSIICMNDSEKKAAVPPMDFCLSNAGAGKDTGFLENDRPPKNILIHKESVTTCHHASLSGPEVNKMATTHPEKTDEEEQADKLQVPSTRDFETAGKDFGLLLKHDHDPRNVSIGTESVTAFHHASLSGPEANKMDTIHPEKTEEEVQPDKLHVRSTCDFEPDGKKDFGLLLEHDRDHKIISIGTESVTACHHASLSGPEVNKMDTIHPEKTEEEVQVDKLHVRSTRDFDTDGKKDFGLLLEHDRDPKNVSIGTERVTTCHRASLPDPLLKHDHNPKNVLIGTESVMSCHHASLSGLEANKMDTIHPEKTDEEEQVDKLQVLNTRVFETGYKDFGLLEHDRDPKNVTRGSENVATWYPLTLSGPEANKMDTIHPEKAEEEEQVNKLAVSNASVFEMTKTWAEDNHRNASFASKESASGSVILKDSKEKDTQVRDGMQGTPPMMPGDVMLHHCLHDALRGDTEESRPHPPASPRTSFESLAHPLPKHLHGMSSFHDTNHFQELSDCDSSSSSDEEDFVNIARATHSSHFDMKRLLLCLENGATTLSQIEGKDVILVMGKTGTGKSTFIQGIAGRQLRQTVHETTRHGHTVCKQVYEAENALCGFDIGHAKESMTKCIRCYVPASTGNGLNLAYVDCPGFEDTSGAEVDIATSVMISHVVQESLSICFVILINYTSLLEDRGGSVRAVLKLIRTFVHDFKSNKTSFAFLFTHIDVIKEIKSGSLVNARKCLRAEIIRTLEGTRDASELEILEHMERSLKKQLKDPKKKRYQLVDVLHPIETNFSELKGTVESMKQLKKKYIPGNNGMTPILQMKFSAEVQSHLLRLRRLLNEAPVTVENTEATTEVLKTFQLLAKHIDIEVLRQAKGEAYRLIGKHMEKLVTSAKEEIARGTTLGQEFNCHNIDTIQVFLQCIQHLGSFLPDSIQPTELQLYMEEQVHEFQKTESVEREGCLDYSNFAMVLKRLKCWSDGFSAFTIFYLETRRQVDNKLCETCEHVRDFDLSRLSTMTLNEISCFFQKFISLHSASSDAADLLGEHNICIEKVIKTVSEGMLNLQCEVDSIPRNDMASHVELYLPQYAMLLHALGVIDDLVKVYPKFSQLACSIDSAKHRLEFQVKTYFSEIFDTLGSEKCFKSQLQTVLKNLHQRIMLFDGMTGSFIKEIQSRFFETKLNIKSTLQRRIEEIWFLVKEICLSGFKKGGKEKEVTEFLFSWLWFDEFLEADSQFILKHIEEMEKIYSDRIHFILSETDHHLFALSNTLEEAFDSAKHLKNILLPELFIITSLEPKYQEKEMAVKSQILHYINLFIKNAITCFQTWKDVLSQWKTELSKPMTGGLDDGLYQTLCEKRRDANKVMGELDDIATLSNLCGDSSIGNVKDLKEQLARSFGELSQSLMCVVSVKGRFRAKMYALLVAEMLTSFSILKLEEYETLKAKAKVSVKVDAEKIILRFSQTSDWTQLEADTNRFRNGVMIDRFVSGEASSYLATINKLQEKKGEKMQAHLQKLIDEKKFTAIRGILEPLSSGHCDFQRKDQFSKLHVMVSSFLTSIHKEALAVLSGHKITVDGATKVAQNMKILENADKDLGPSINKNGFFLSHDISALKKNMNTIVHARTSSITASVKKMDFLELNTSAMALSAILETGLKMYLSPKSKLMIETALSDYKKAMESVSDCIDAFLDSGLTEESQTIECLDRLKVFHEQSLSQKTLSSEIDLYERTQERLVNKLNELYQTIACNVDERCCYDEGITWLHSLDRNMRKGLERHVSCDSLKFSCTQKLEEWRFKKQEQDQEMEFDGCDAEKKLEIWAESLEKLDPRRWRIPFFGYRKENNTSYGRLCAKLNEKVGRSFQHGKEALQVTKDLFAAQKHIELLDLINQKVGKYIPKASEKKDELNRIVLESFVSLCEDVRQALKQGGLKQLERLFPDYRAFIIHIPFSVTTEEGKLNLSLTNQLVYETLECEIAELTSAFNSLSFHEIKRKIEDVRASGDFVADRFTLLHEEMTRSTHISVDNYLDKIFRLCDVHFRYGRDLGKIKFYASLGLVPSASPQEIKKAYDKIVGHISRNIQSSKDPFFEKAHEAFEELNSVISITKRSTRKPFDDLVHGLFDKLRDTVRDQLNHQQYDQVEMLLYKIQSLQLLNDLTYPPFDSQKTCQAVTDLVKAHVQRSRVDIETTWSEHNFKLLNDHIRDIKLMESHFKSYPEIFPTSWNTGVLENIEREIEALGSRARDYLADRSVASQKFDDFRRCFLRMGFVLNELPSFQDCTKSIMSSVLESCLSSDWGYDFLFQLGLSLQKGDESCTDEENLVAQMLVGEFSHFKEVQTMTWNEETSQKPPEDTVSDIRGEQHRGTMVNELEIDSHNLLMSFYDFEHHYRNFLGEYLGSDSDVNDLIHKLVKTADALKPVQCHLGWGNHVKSALPIIIAGVFAVFTVLKSAASYNRIEDKQIGEKILMKPHNIQVLTLLCILGCGDPLGTTLENQVMQIRTGEGKSLILGAAAVVLALLGFQVHCICYSEYLSNRDYELFKDLFGCFGVSSSIKYSKVTTLSEETTLEKGDIRKMTEDLLCGKTSDRPKVLSLATRQPETNEHNLIDSLEDRKNDHGQFHGPPSRRGKNEILIVDEFDVFFGPDFYGQTYNQVAQLRDPEVAEILKVIWKAHHNENKKLRLRDIQEMETYKVLLGRYHDFTFLLENEIELMLDQVKCVNDEPYYLDRLNNRIGYKVWDTIQYDITYGYCTMFAYLQEAEKGNLKDPGATLDRVLTMPVSCGQFSYANISPLRILGVSGTVEAMGSYEKAVLGKYGIERFVYVPSVYGKSNFQFDAAGSGIHIEVGTSDFFHKINDVISTVTKMRRAAIVFFQNIKSMREYTSSPFYKKLGRQKLLLTEDMSTADKEFVIKKAATAGQITICTAVFGRGTDFFCKDEGVQKHGGVHIIQAFLSEELSEEIQIKGRTARQGKKGSYQMILLESDLKENFGIKEGEKDKVPKENLYEWLCEARNKAHNKQCHTMDENLDDATKKDQRTHQYFDALLAGDHKCARAIFQEIYFSMKTPSLAARTEIDLAFVIDITGSMGPFASSIAATVKTLVDSQGALMGKLLSSFPDTEFVFHVAALGFRDISDGNKQFNETHWQSNGHFTENTNEATRFIESITKGTSGGGDIAEDVLGAISQCAQWNAEGDWKSKVKFMMVFTDAPAHGLVAASSVGTPHFDDYSSSHPKGLTAEKVMGLLLSKGIDLFVGSFNPVETSRMEQEFSKQYMSHPDNLGQRDITVIPLVPNSPQSSPTGSAIKYNRHIVFVLDESGSMMVDWNGVVVAYRQYIYRRQQHQCDSDLVSVVQFSDKSRVTVQQTQINQAPTQLYYGSGGTAFHPASINACNVARATPTTHTPVIVFMSDGQAGDAASAAKEFSSLNHEIQTRTGSDLELHVIAFGSGVSMSQLQSIARSSSIGSVRSSKDTADLSKVFAEIAGGVAVADLLEAEIGKRVSEAVSNKLTLEFMG